MIDYRELLKRYIRRVIQEEGTSFVEYMPWGEAILSEEDVKELEALEKEAFQESEER